MAAIQIINISIAKIKDYFYFGIHIKMPEFYVRFRYRHYLFCDIDTCRQSRYISLEDIKKYIAAAKKYGNH